jgi:hypothetical protein
VIKSHELAKQLLELPNLPVVIDYNGECVIGSDSPVVVELVNHPGEEFCLVPVFGPEIGELEPTI